MAIIGKTSCLLYSTRCVVQNTWCCAVQSTWCCVEHAVLCRVRGAGEYQFVMRSAIQNQQVLETPTNVDRVYEKFAKTSRLKQMRFTWQSIIICKLDLGPLFSEYLLFHLLPNLEIFLVDFFIHGNICICSPCPTYDIYVVY